MHHYLFMMLLYVGPDQTMPITSALASILGLLLIFWTKLRMILSKAITLLRNWRAKI